MFDSLYWLWLSLIFETGSPVCDSLLQAFNHNPKSIYEADKEALSPFCNGSEQLLNRLLDKKLNRAYAILDFCQKENVGVLTPTSRNFPSSLLKISAQPLVLYYKGRLPDFSRSLGVAVVGTRSVTAYGSSAAYTISHDLASSGATVISGMALGADTAAHRGSLDAGGHTVAFLGCGIDIIYPKDNARLMQEIMASGTVMTEYAPGLPPEGRHFPVRNRLISGVSSAVLVIEATEKSGALITASHGLKQGKLIYAVPGKVGELASTGTNLLIRNGAKMVTSAKDILSDFSGLYEFRYNGNKNANTNYQRDSVKSSPSPTNLNSENHSENTATANGSAKNSSQFPNTATANGSARNSSQFPNTATANGSARSSSQFSNTATVNGSARNSSQFPNTATANGSVRNSSQIASVTTANEGLDGAEVRDFNKAPLGFTSDNHFVNTQQQRAQRFIAAQPRPTVLYNGMTEEEAAASYMSMETEIGARTSSYARNEDKVFLTYPSEPMPSGGYEINLTKEKIKSFEKSPLFDLNPSLLDGNTPFSAIPYQNTNPIETDRADKKSTRKKLISFGQKKTRTDNAQTEKPAREQTKKDKKVTESDTASPQKQISYEGLNETESKVLKFIFEHQPVSIDGMNSLGLSVSQILSTVTMLEIKQKINQRAGGYFEIKK